MHGMRAAGRGGRSCGRRPFRDDLHPDAFAFRRTAGFLTERFACWMGAAPISCLPGGQGLMGGIAAGTGMPRCMLLLIWRHRSQAFFAQLASALPDTACSSRPEPSSHVPGMILAAPYANDVGCSSPILFGVSGSCWPVELRGAATCAISGSGIALGGLQAQGYPPPRWMFRRLVFAQARNSGSPRRPQLSSASDRGLVALGLALDLLLLPVADCCWRSRRCGSACYCLAVCPLVGGELARGSRRGASAVPHLPAANMRYLACIRVTALLFDL